MHASGQDVAAWPELPTQDLCSMVGGEGLLYQVGYVVGYGVGDMLAPLVRAIYERFT